ncbi:M24 family metallopeptidase [Salarchaeum japonicum]|uniref:Xaa-Pro peptidase family protein n=1 Tax=Salarchaeum japonicum TaxID=555573 RepID=A0AAV3T2S5_9EURY|nr:Xaa-Pro peptidase family protein [Salarchaeum japonicum]
MEPDFGALDDALDAADADGYLLDADASTSDQLYLSGFDASDPFVSLYTPDETVLLVSGLEFTRAKRESRADAVRRYADYDYQEKRANNDTATARDLLYAEFLDEFGVESVLVNERFPLATADGLRDHGVSVDVDDDDTVGTIRATKTAAEVEHVKAAQDANEAAMRAAQTLIEAATVRDGVLHYEGDPLTSERVKEEIEVTLLRHGCSLDETIVACGESASIPHDRGSGPLRADETIIIDIFPRDKETKYHADMTRTFVKGDATDEAREFYDITREALDAAFDALEPGATGEDVHHAVCDVYEDAGYPTLRSDPSTETGYIHSTGHGVGLDVHEAPSVSTNATDELEPGHVVTIEPGLYDPDIGGVRLEDIVVVTEDGYENFTDYPLDFEL